MSTVRPAAGFRYPSGYGVATQVMSNLYHQFPVVFRCRIWQPRQRLLFRIGAGIAYNVDLGKFAVIFPNVLEESTLNPDGTKLLLMRFRTRYEQKKSFFSGEVNVSAQYQLSNRFSASLEAKRLISAMGIVSYNATQETFNPPAFNKVESRGGANSYSVNLGIAYQFGFRNRYHLRD